MRANWEERWYPSDTTGARGGAHWPLRGAAGLYGMAVAARNTAYDVGFLPAVRVEGARVVSVGNVNVGGTGKTPVVIFLAQWAQRAGRKVAVLSRGHGRLNTDPVFFDADTLAPWEAVGDEPRLIAQRCKSVKVMVGSDRVELARRAVHQCDCDFLILDDGFQHRALARDVDLLVWDSDVGAGNGALLPAGPLREPLKGMGRADVLWARGSGAILPDRDTFRGTRVRATHAPAALLGPDGAELSLEVLRGKPVVALAGLARPSGFKSALERLGADVKRTHFFADHHPFTAREVQEALAAAKSSQAWLVTTEKDAQRLPAALNAYQLRLGIQVDDGLASLAQLLGLDPSLAAASPMG